MKNLENTSNGGQEDVTGSFAKSRNVGPFATESLLMRAANTQMGHQRTPSHDIPAFTVNSSKIPTTAPSRSPENRRQRIRSLMIHPEHREAVPKFDPKTMQRTVVPFTQEDHGLYNNLPLINTLRLPITSPGIGEGSGGNPPSFLDDDMRKWSKRFQPVVKDRQQYKRLKLAETLMSPVNHNTNVVNEAHRKPLYTAGQIQAEKSEFKKVLTRRKSRLSTEMHNTVDFELCGHQPFYNEFVPKQNKWQLSYVLNLRNQRPNSDFKADQPWQYPAHKSFKPSECLADFREQAQASNYDPKNKFTDKFDEFNGNMIAHTMEKSTTVYQNVAWNASLRGDRRARNQEREKAKRQKSKH